MTVRFVFAWYDLWVGAYYDRVNRAWYVMPLPCIGVRIQRRQPRGKPFPPEWEAALADWRAAHAGIGGAE